MKRQMRLKKKAADLYPMQTREETFAKLSVRNIVSMQEVPSLPCSHWLVCGWKKKNKNIVLNSKLIL